MDTMTEPLHAPAPWTQHKLSETYRAVVETGSCSVDYKRWEERETCGHNHRTIEAARKCLKQKQAHICRHGRPSGAKCAHCTGGVAGRHETSALWYNGRIHNQDGERVN